MSNWEKWLSSAKTERIKRRPTHDENGFAQKRVKQKRRKAPVSEVDNFWLFDDNDHQHHSGL